MIPYASCLCCRRPEEPRMQARRWIVFPNNPERRPWVTMETGEGNVVVIRVNNVSSSPDAPPSVPSDDALLATLDTSECVRPRSATGRFLTLHKRRRRRLSTRALVGPSYRALLDDMNHGQVQGLLDRVGDWNFNAFNLDNMSGGRGLPVLCLHLFHLYGLIKHFNLDAVIVWKFFTLVEEGYHSSNPYHNAIHASDVTQAMHCFLQEEKIREHLTPLEAMASLLAAVTHDLDHPGVNQPFLIATSNHLASLYKNASVLEQHHWRSAVGCLLESGVGQCLGPENMAQLAEQLRSLILATDITQQQDFLLRFKCLIDTQTLDMSLVAHRHLILQMALKCADICNPCRVWDVSKKWALKVCDEFFRQGDFERKLKLPVTSLYDRYTASVPKIQTGFFRFVVSPLFEEWHRFLGTPLSTTMMKQLRTNQARWEALLQQELAEETHTEISDTEAPDNPESSEEGDIGEVVETYSKRRRSLAVGERQVAASCSATRRHSVPLGGEVRGTVVGATLIRRESVPNTGTLPVRYTSETILHVQDSGDGEGGEKMGYSTSSLHVTTSDNDTHGSKLSLESSCEVDSHDDGSEPQQVSAESLLPEPSIASISSTVLGSAPSSSAYKLLLGATVSSLQQYITPSGTGSHLPRQMTFPPPFVPQRQRYLSSAAVVSEPEPEPEKGSGECPGDGCCGTPTTPVSSPSICLPPRSCSYDKDFDRKRERAEGVQEKENIWPRSRNMRIWRSLNGEEPSCGQHQHNVGVSAAKRRRGSAPVSLSSKDDDGSDLWSQISKSNATYLRSNKDNNQQRHSQMTRRGSLPFDIITNVHRVIPSVGSSGGYVETASTVAPLVLPRRRSADGALEVPMARLRTRRGSMPNSEAAAFERLSDIMSSTTPSASSLKRSKTKCVLQRRGSAGPELLFVGGDVSPAVYSIRWRMRRGSLPADASTMSWSSAQYSVRRSASAVNGTTAWKRL